MKIAMTGASGMIGRRLVAELATHSLVVLGRKRGNLRPGVQFVEWDAMSGPPAAEALDGVEAVIHLAGEPVAQRWSAEAKQRIRESREVGTRHLVEGMAGMTRPPRVLVCASAVGIYGFRGEEELTERSLPGQGFLSDVCVAWEREADAASVLGTRAVKMRTGIVLAREGGALEQMLPPFRSGVGGRLGSGSQWMSWIHLDDVAGLYRYALEKEDLRGAVNVTAPAPARNLDFTKELGRALHRPTIFPVPAFALRVLFGEMAEMLLGSQRVMPRAAEAAGYRFRHRELAGALRDILSGIQ